jgi:hypothetical protein
MGTAAIIAIMVMLAHFNNQSVGSWHSRISLNAFVSALSQLAQSALIVSVASCIGQQQWTWFKNKRMLDDLRVFDSATRGPAGSLWILWRHPARYFYHSAWV